MVSSNLGIDINGMISNDSVSVGYYVQGNSTMQSINLKSGNMIQGWIDYDSAKNELNVSLSLSSTKPSSLILTFQIDLSSIFEDTMYVGFSASIGGSFEAENKTNIDGHNTQVVLLAGLMEAKCEDPQYGLVDNDGDYDSAAALSNGVSNLYAFRLQPSHPNLHHGGGGGVPGGFGSHDLRLA
ncbi:hypothetical protein TEA_028513 [Camellia sinensis var. sinensis]|uniref:Legume lectin domain-containing protein n=1 Tax=Camellia sinensis var. sinensis TaxID=542762 RepID=A0A4S4ESD0_CAMSN|nr:hypothetical protein TEA_028513 [Camellia sinensis var. sinensis]